MSQDFYDDPLKDCLEHFTPRALRALQLAAKEAARWNHDHLGCRHMLLGILAVKDSIAVQVLASGDKISFHLFYLLIKIKIQSSAWCYCSKYRTPSVRGYRYRADIRLFPHSRRSHCKEYV